MREGDEEHITSHRSFVLRPKLSFTEWKSRVGYPDPAKTLGNWVGEFYDFLTPRPRVLAAMDRLDEFFAQTSKRDCECHINSSNSPFTLTRLCSSPRSHPRGELMI